MLTPQPPSYYVDKTELRLLLNLMTEETTLKALVEPGDQKQNQKWIFQCGDLIKNG